MKSKLVRDKIVRMMRDRGMDPEYKIITTKSAQWDLLLNKLDEEVKEFKDGPTIEELADITEVCRALADKMGYGFDDLEAVRYGKATARGGFYSGYVLTLEETP